MHTTLVRTKETMKAKQKRNWCIALVTATSLVAGGTASAVTITMEEGHNTLVTLNGAGAYGSVAPADTTYGLGGGQIYSSYVVMFSEPVYLTSLVLDVDRNYDGPGPGDVHVDFTGTTVKTPGNSPYYGLYDGPPGAGTPAANELAYGTLLVGGGPFTTLVITDHKVGVGGDVFSSTWSFTAVAADESEVSGEVTVTNNVVPEPGVALLGTLGLVGLLRRRRQ